MPLSKLLLPLGLLAVSSCAFPAPQVSQVSQVRDTPNNVLPGTGTASIASKTCTATGSATVLTAPQTANGTAAGTSGAASGAPCPPSFPAEKCYKDDSDFPAQSSWLSWNCLSSQNLPAILAGKSTGPDEAKNIISAIQSVAQTAGIDPRIPLAVLMQESTGNVRPIHGDGGKSAGIFQVQIPNPATCDGTAFNQCPMSTITTMVQNGLYGHNGTSSPPITPGLAYWLKTENNDVAKAVRGYNTGSIPDPVNLTNVTVGTPAYSSDIGNRLVGGIIGGAKAHSC